MAVGEATEDIAQRRMASGEGSIIQFADSRMATACCFAGRTAGAGIAAMLEKVLVKLRTGAVAACYCCHFCHDVLATRLFL